MDNLQQEKAGRDKTWSKDGEIMEVSQRITERPSGEQQH